MSARIAPLSDGLGIASIADKQPRLRRDIATPSFADAVAGAESSAIPVQPAFTPPAAEDEHLPASTLFATAMLSAQIPDYRATLEEYRIRQNRDWTPPESLLRLKDKTI